MNYLHFLILVSGISFLVYGITHFTSEKMKNEFIRFNLEKFGIVTAVLELLGGAGLLCGLFYTPLHTSRYRSGAVHVGITQTPG